MATFTITGRISAKTVKKNFNESFGGTLRILKNGKPVDDGATMASLKADDSAIVIMGVVIAQLKPQKPSSST